MRPSSVLGACAYLLDLTVLLLEDIAHRLDRAGV